MFAGLLNRSLVLEDVCTRPDVPSQRLFHQTIPDTWNRLCSSTHSLIHKHLYRSYQVPCTKQDWRRNKQETLISKKLYLVRSYLQIHIIWNKSEYCVGSHREIAVVGIRRGRDNFQMIWEDFVKCVFRNNWKELNIGICKKHC